MWIVLPFFVDFYQRGDLANFLCRISGGLAPCLNVAGSPHFAPFDATMGCLTRDHRFHR